MKSFLISAFLVANLGLLVSSQEYMGTKDMDVLQKDFMTVEEDFEAAKSGPDSTKLDAVLEAVKQLKARIVTFQEQNRKDIDAVKGTFMEQIVREVDFLGSEQIDEALTMIGQEIVGYRAGYNQLVEREDSTKMTVEIGRALATFATIKVTGDATQKLIDNAPNLSRRLISTNIGLMISTAQSGHDHLAEEYQTKLLEYNFQNTKNLRIKQIYLIRRFLNMFAYADSYFQSYKDSHGY